MRFARIDRFSVHRQCPLCARIAEIGVAEDPASFASHAMRYSARVSRTTIGPRITVALTQPRPQSALLRRADPTLGLRVVRSAPAFDRRRELPQGSNRRSGGVSIRGRLRFRRGRRSGAGRRPRRLFSRQRLVRWTEHGRREHQIGWADRLAEGPRVDIAARTASRSAHHGWVAGRWPAPLSRDSAGQAQNNGTPVLNPLPSSVHRHLRPDL